MSAVEDGMTQNARHNARHVGVVLLATVLLAQPALVAAQAAPPLPLPPVRPKDLGAPAAASPPPSATPPSAPVALPAPAPQPEPPLVTIPGKVNLNGATAEQLATLPDIGRARQILIVAERGRGRYKNWDDFVRRMQGTAVDAEVLAKIKEVVSF